MKVLIVGGSGGIGRGLIEQLQKQAFESPLALTATYHNTKPDNTRGVQWRQLDATVENAVAAFAREHSSVNWLINCVGLLHSPQLGPEKSLRQFAPDAFSAVIQTNTLPSLLLAKHFAAAFKKQNPATFAAVSAKVGSIDDNRLGGWYSYRISKAALNMALKSISLEWRRSLPNVSVAALHPGTTDTALSQPFQNNVPKDKLFSPTQTADYLLNILRDLTPEHSGQFWSWDGTTLPW